MIFKSIELTNLFTYRGKQVLDLTGASSERNVVLISGRNGFGKTSLLNSVKLLFTGVTDSLRQSVLRQRTPTAKQYVIGAGDDWWGIMNRRARADGQKHCGVRIVWDEEGHEVVAERRWLFEENDFTEELEISATFLKETLRDEDAQRFIDQRLPTDYVPFFFFDGEQIQELAEANSDAQQQHIERLLNISHIETLRDNLKAAISDWRDDAMDEAERAALTKLKADLTHLEGQAIAAQQRREEFEENIGELNGEIKELRRKLESYRSFVHGYDENRLKEEKKRLEDELGELSHKVADTLPRDVALLVNPALAEAALDELQRLTQSRRNDQGEMIEALRQHLPADLLDRLPHSTPPLSPEQREFYRNRLSKLLEAYAPPSGTDEQGLIALDMGRARLLSQLLGGYPGNHALRAERAEDLQRLQAIKVRLRNIAAELDNVSSLSAAEREAYEQYRARLEAHEQELIDLEVERRKLDSETSAFATQIEKQQEAVAKQEAKVKMSEHIRDKVDLARKLQKFFGDYKDRLKKDRRAQIEDALNRHFSRLMTSNNLIQHIGVDDNFRLHYLDVENQPIGMGNLSAGMKQLAATALLWALKECSARPIPIVIDTPLARIDRGNQENLLLNYYPKVGQQVVILPTDSELDEEKYRLLKPRVYAEYRLYNPDGDHTEIIGNESMYAEVNSHG